MKWNTIKQSETKRRSGTKQNKSNASKTCTNETECTRTKKYESVDVKRKSQQNKKGTDQIQSNGKAQYGKKQTNQTKRNTNCGTSTIATEPTDPRRPYRTNRPKTTVSKQKLDRFRQVYTSNVQKKLFMAELRPSIWLCMQSSFSLSRD